MKYNEDDSINGNSIDDLYSALIHFLKEGGAEFPLLAIKPYNTKHNSKSAVETGTQRGVFTVGRKDEGIDTVVKADTVILKIPLGLLITVSTAREESEVGRLMYIQEKRISETDGDNEEIEDDWTGEIDLDNEGSRYKEGTEENISKNENENEYETEYESGDDDSEFTSDELDDDDICDVLGLDMSAPMHCYLAAFILEDRLNPSSRFLPYYNSLPLVLPHIPLFWSNDDLHHLHGSFVYLQVLNRKNAIKHDYKETCRIYPSFANIATLNDYNWARMIVTSRNFGLDITTNTDDDFHKSILDLDGMNVVKMDSDTVNISSVANDSSGREFLSPSISDLLPHPSPHLSPTSSISLPPLPPSSITPSSVALKIPMKLPHSVHPEEPSVPPVVPLTTLPSLVMPMTTLVPFGDMLNHYRPRQVGTCLCEYALTYF
jgi:hypothetical protein